MNAHLHDDHDRLRFEAALAARLAILFRDCPALCGFTVEQDLAVPGSVTCHFMDGISHAEEILGVVAEMLSEVVEAEPDAIERLKGRTFARILH
jgi:hypothetical protein